MSNRDFLFEIGTEEIPAGFIPRALLEMETRFKRALEKARIEYGEIGTLGTPRRLTLTIKALSETQPETSLEVRGPKVEAAYGKDGNPTKALEGFARGQGVELTDIVTVEAKKGAHVVARKVVEGKVTMDILPEILSAVVTAELFPKAMRWGSGRTAFGRPVHWIVALYGPDTVDFEYAGIKSGNRTRGHRFLSNSGGPVIVNGIDDYADALRNESVIVDPEERRTIIIDGLKHEADAAGGCLLPDEALIDEVVNLVEFPVVLRGGFDKSFLSLPREVIINAMRSHQRYFSLTDDKGALLPYFLTVANIAAKDPEVVIKGNERVLRARLNDANFYFEHDKKKPLSEWLNGLKGVVFQAKLGTSYEKVERFTALALKIGEWLGHKDMKGLKRASMLSKADLVTGVVMEFPKLQGVMGGVYAAIDGEGEEVSSAVREHYMPVAAGAELPSTTTGAIISIADKMDTIAGCFGVGLIPTGAQDPYALRRAAIGIIAIIVEKGFQNLSLGELIGASVAGIGTKLTREGSEVKADIKEFFKERLKNQLLASDLSFDVIDSVLSTTDWDGLVDAVKRIRALEGFKGNPDCARLVIAFKRVTNILKGVELAEGTAQKPDVTLFTDPNESTLAGLCQKIAPEIEKLRAKGDYEGVFKKLTSIKEPIDAFFDEVMVMVDDAAVRENRLRLLNSIRSLYVTTADLSKLTTAE